MGAVDNACYIFLFFQFGRKRINSYAEAEAERYRLNNDGSGDEGFSDMDIEQDGFADNESDISEGASQLLISESRGLSRTTDISRFSWPRDIQWAVVKYKENR